MSAKALSTARELHAAGRFDEAVRACRAIVDLHSDDLEAAQFLGRCYLDAGKVGEAVTVLETAAACLPASGKAQFELGLALQAAGRPADAAAAFRRALALDPSDPDHWCRLAVVLRRIQDWTGAAAAYLRALELSADFPEAMLGLGSVRIRQEQWAEAARYFRRFLELHPEQIDALAGLGTALLEEGKFAEAVPPLKSAVAQRPHHLDALVKLGNTYRALERQGDAITVFRAALEVAPRSPEILTNLGNALWAARDFAAALALHRQALQLRPDHAATYNNIGNALLGLLRYVDAEAAFQHSLRLKADPATLCNLGNVHLAQNRLEPALRFYREARASDPGFKQAVFNEALVHLLRGDLPAGLPGYELRWILRQKKSPAKLPSVLWQGEQTLEGKTILVCCEQGLGDSIQFVRYVPLLQARGARVILRVQKPLVGLLACLPGIVLATPDDEILPAFDFYCLLMSLPLALRTELATIPSTTPYLQSPSEKSAFWRERLDCYPGPRIGLVCSGNADHRNDYNRSVPLEQFASLARISGGQFFLVQKDVRPGDQKALECFSGLVSLAPEIEDFTDTAAILENLDLLISVDTSVAHLAGALGRPAWILLPFAPDWRWMLDRSDSPWYPTVRLFRQPAPAQWEPVLAEVAKELRRTFAAPSAS